MATNSNLPAEAVIEKALRRSLEKFQHYHFPESYMRPLIRYWQVENRIDHMQVGYQLGNYNVLSLAHVRRSTFEHDVAEEMLHIFVTKGIESLYRFWTTEEEVIQGEDGRSLYSPDRHHYPKLKEN